MEAPGHWLVWIDDGSHTRADIREGSAMLLKTLLNLRTGGDRVSVIVRPGNSRPELGVARPQQDDRRAAHAGAWGPADQRGRPPSRATIDEPLPARTQTILSHRLPHEIREAINGDVTDALPASRRHDVAVKFRL